MAKSILRLKARGMRKAGKSVRDIARQLNVSKSSISLWVRDIILTVEQLEKLQNRLIKGRELGRLKGSLSQKRRRMDVEKEEVILGIKKPRFFRFLVPRAFIPNFSKSMTILA